MKNFLSKKSSMITLLILAVAFLAIYIVMLARPVSYGWGYTGKHTEAGVTTKARYTIWNDKTVTIKTVTSAENVKDTVYEMDCWMIRDGKYVISGNDYVKEFKKFVILGEEATAEDLKDMNENQVMTEEDYNDMVKFAEEMKKADKDAYYESLKERANTVNAFKITEKIGDKTYEYTCRGAIAFAIVGGIVELVLVAGAAMAVVNNLKK